MTDQAEEHGVSMDLEIPGVGEEEAGLEIPGVGKEEEDEADDDFDDQSTQDEVAVEQPLHHPKQKTIWGAGITCTVAEIRIMIIATQEKTLSLTMKLVSS